MKIRRNFTMVEILAVMAIIAILAGIGIGGYSYAMHASRESATKSTIKRLETALEAMKAKYGFYPPGDGSTKIKIVALNKLSTNWPINGISNSTQNEKYMEEFIKMMDLDVTTARVVKQEGTSDIYFFIDGWGKEIYYQCPGQVNRNSFDLVSAGADGYFTNASGNLVDMPSLYDRTNFTDGSGVANCDDITNF